MIEVQNNHVYAYGTIGDSYSGEDFAAALRRAERYGSPVVHLHTLGGSVMDGLLMVNAVKSSTWPVTVVVEGVAASMGAIFMLSAAKVKVASNALIMLHSSSSWGGGNAKELESQAELLKKTDAALRSSFTTRGIEPATVDSWFDGEDHWFTADEALAAGLVDEVVAPVVTAQLSKPLLPEELQRITASLECIFSNNKIMLNISELLGLAPTASEEEIKTAVSALKAEAAKAQEYCRKSIESQISAALDAGKITAEQKDSLQAFGEKMGADALHSLLDGMQVRQTLRDQIVHGSKGSAKKFNDYTRDELLRMKQEDPTRFKELLDAKYRE